MLPSILHKVFTDCNIKTLCSMLHRIPKHYRGSRYWKLPFIDVMNELELRTEGTLHPSYALMWSMLVIAIRVNLLPSL
jgi:hypothetical protein